MAAPRVLILRAPGTNCDLETAYAFQRAGATTQSVHINQLFDEPHLTNDFQVLCLPGGFSYGDDIAAGRMVIVADDENRENEGDLVMAAEKATPETINMMIRYGSGIVCVPTVEHVLRRRYARVQLGEVPLLTGALPRCTWYRMTVVRDDDPRVLAEAAEGEGRDG